MEEKHATWRIANVASVERKRTLDTIVVRETDARTLTSGLLGTDPLVARDKSQRVTSVGCLICGAPSKT